MTLSVPEIGPLIVYCHPKLVSLLRYRPRKRNKRLYLSTIAVPEPKFFFENFCPNFGKNDHGNAIKSDFKVLEHYISKLWWKFTFLVLNVHKRIGKSIFSSFCSNLTTYTYSGKCSHFFVLGTLLLQNIPEIYRVHCEN